MARNSRNRCRTPGGGGSAFTGKRRVIHPVPVLAPIIDVWKHCGLGLSLIDWCAVHTLVLSVVLALLDVFALLNQT